MPTKTILHVYSGNLMGGVERMLQSMAALRSAEFEHAFALCFPGKLAFALTERGAALDLLGPVRLRNPLSVVRARAALKRLVHERKPDAVVCHGIWSYCIFAPTLERLRYAPILYLHDVPDAKSAFYRWAWRNPPRLCIVNSNYTKSFTEQLKPRVPVAIVYPLVAQPPAISPTRAALLRAELGAHTTDVVILQASRFEAWKGHRHLIEALRQLRDLPGWRCWLAGEPQRPQEVTYKNELKALIASHGLTDRVTFIGHRDDMGAVLAACDIYCQPNEGPEPFGMLFVEALNAGKPVVASALGGALEIVSEDCGILCEAEASSVAAALKRLLENPPLRAAMSLAGPSRAARAFSPTAFEVQLRAALDTAQR